jgi:hypothetical protein
MSHAAPTHPIFVRAKALKHGDASYGWTYKPRPDGVHHPAKFFFSCNHPTSITQNLRFDKKAGNDKPMSHCFVRILFSASHELEQRTIHTLAAVLTDPDCCLTRSVVHALQATS